MEKQAKTCVLCNRKLSIENFYDAKRSLCIECERKTARQRMRLYRRTLRGKAAQALTDARKTIRKNNYDVLDDLTVDQLIDAFEFFDSCAYCGKPFSGLSDMSIEHIVPLSKGGDNTISNICIVHRSCNSKKHDRSVSEVFGDKVSQEIEFYKEWLSADDKHVRELEKVLRPKLDRLEGLFALYHQ